jgi:hypothetical protein
VSERDPFNTPKEEIDRLVSELGGVKDLVREVSAQLGRIETRMKRAFPSAFAATAFKQARGASVRQEPGMSAEEALRVYEELVDRARAGARPEVQARLSGMAAPDLDLIRRELGIPLGSKKPSRKALVSLVLSRINESVMIGQHSNRGRLLSSSTEAGPEKEPESR